MARRLRKEGEAKGVRRVKRMLELALCEAVGSLPDRGPTLAPWQARELVARTLSRVLADVERLER